MKDLKLKHQLLQAELISQRNKKEQFIKSINKKINELKSEIIKQIELLEWVIEKGE